VLNESPDGIIVCEHCLKAGHIDNGLQCTRDVLRNKHRKFAR
jgi:hypothetical protein